MNQECNRELQTIGAMEIFSKLTNGERDQVIEMMCNLLDKREKEEEKECF